MIIVITGVNAQKHQIQSANLKFFKRDILQGTSARVTSSKFRWFLLHMHRFFFIFNIFTIIMIFITRWRIMRGILIRTFLLKISLNWLNFLMEVVWDLICMLWFILIKFLELFYFLLVVYIYSIHWPSLLLTWFLFGRFLCIFFDDWLQNINNCFFMWIE